MESFSIINPYTNKIIESKILTPFFDIDASLKKLNQGFNQWRFEPINHRKTIIKQLGNRLSKNKKEFAVLITSDMGKPINESIREVEKCIQCCEYYAKIASAIEKRLTQCNGIREPLGVILAIMPWNYPLWQIIRCVIPSLITGNTCLIKPSFNTVRIAEKLKEIVANPNLIDARIPTNAHTEDLISHPLVAGVSFTGSQKAGKIVAGLSAQQLKPCVLELGGSDPFVVFKDANLPSAIQSAVQSKFTNAGQVCIAAKRFLFEESIFDTAIQLFKEKTKEYLHYGNPMLPSTTIGPLARIDIKNNLTQQMSHANIPKDRIVYEYLCNDHLGNFSPMIIDGRNLPSTNVLYQEEVFGPIAICDSFESVNEAIQKANHPIFGLGASIWSKNKKTIQECTLKIECGTIAINSIVHSTVDTPFGGRKQSGLGLELGVEGALSFTGFKAILDPT